MRNTNGKVWHNLILQHTVYMNIKINIYIKHSEAHTSIQLPHLMRLNENINVYVFKKNRII